MDFPRFTSGQVGRLEWSHLNDAFSMLDRLRPLLLGMPGEGELPQRYLLARILDSTSEGLMEWEEVVPTEAQSPLTVLGWQVREGGASSGAQGTQDFEPAFQPPTFGSTETSPLAQDSVVLLRQLTRPGGQSVWLVVSVAAPAANVFPAIITGAQQRTPWTDGIVYQWLYAWDEARINQENDYQWTVLPGGRCGRLTGGTGCYGPAFNGAEINGVVGAGGSAGGLVTERNARVANGCVVMMSQTANGLHYFSLGNTLTVTCTPP